MEFHQCGGVKSPHCGLTAWGGCRALRVSLSRNSTRTITGSSSLPLPHLNGREERERELCRGTPESKSSLGIVMWRTRGVHKVENTQWRRDRTEKWMAVDQEGGGIWRRDGSPIVGTGLCSAVSLWRWRGTGHQWVTWSQHRESSQRYQGCLGHHGC